MCLGDVVLDRCDDLIQPRRYASGGGSGSATSSRYGTSAGQRASASASGWTPNELSSIARRVADLLGLGREAILFSDKLWYNPSQSRFCFRDQTVVHYKVGEGVAPHVDGKDATILMYLNDVPEGCGGRTIFSEAGLAMPVRRGTALLYCSKGQNLLHYAERVAEGEKWVSQFLIDFKYRPGMGELKVDYETGAVIA